MPASRLAYWHDRAVEYFRARNAVQEAAMKARR